MNKERIVMSARHAGSKSDRLTAWLIANALLGGQKILLCGERNRLAHHVSEAIGIIKTHTEKHP